MLPHKLTAVLLSLPLLAMIFVSVRCWIEFGKEERRGSGKHYISYNKFFLTLVAIGYFGVWPFWVGGIVFLFKSWDWLFSMLARYSSLGHSISPGST